MKARYFILFALLFAFAVNAQPLRQNPWTTNATGAAFDAQGNDVRNLFKLGLTNGWLTVQTNSQMAAGGGTNENRGVGSVLIGSVQQTNGFNVVTSPNALAVLNAGGSTAAGRTTNSMTSTGRANAMIVNNVTTHAVTNTVSIEDTASGNMVLGTFTTGLGASGVNPVRLRGTAGGNLLVFRALSRGSIDVDSASGNILAARITGGGTNVVGSASQGSQYSAFSTGNGSNHMNATAGVGSLSAQTTAGTLNNFAAALGSVATMYADVGTNETLGGGLYVGRAQTGGIGRVGASAYGALIAYMTDNASATIASGSGGLLVTRAATLYGSSSISGDGASVLGAGTNDFPYSIWLGYQPAGEQPRLMVRTNGVGILTNTPQATLDVNGSAQSHFGFLSGISNVTVTLDEDVFTLITNYQHQTLYGFTATTASGTDGAVTNAVAGYYGVDFSISLESTTLSHLHAAVFTNGVECTLIEAEWEFSASATVRPMSATGIIYMPAGTRTDLRLLNTASAADPIISRVQLRVGHP